MTVRIKVAIEGVTPLLMNRFTDSAAMKATSGSGGSSGAADKGDPNEQAEARLYKSEDGSIIMPQPNLFASIRDGGIFFKVGKRQVTTQKTSMLPSCVAFDSLWYKLEHNKPWSIDTRAVRVPSTGGRILCYRPVFHDWRIAFDVSLDTDIINAKLFRDIVDASGKRIGICDYRPQTKGPFGRYSVTKWVVVA